MEAYVRLAGDAIILATSAAAIQPGVKQVMGSPGDREILSVGAPGSAHIAVREVRVDLDFPSGKNGKGTLLVLFEPTTRYYYWNVEWMPNDYPQKPQIDRLTDGSELVGLAEKGLSVLDLGNPLLFIRETSDRAESIDAANEQALRSASQHIAEMELRTNVYRKSYIDLRGAFPSGFVPEGPRSEPGLQIRLVNAERKSGTWDFLGKPTRSGRWVLTYEGDDASNRVKVTIPDGISCAPSQMGCGGIISGASCVDDQDRDRECARQTR